MIKLQNGSSINLEANVFKAEFNVPFIPPSKIEEKDKYYPFKGKIEVEPDRLFLLYEVLDKTLKGKLLEDTLFLMADTAGESVVSIVPPSALSEKAKKLGGIYRMKFQKGRRNAEKIFTGSIILSLTYINILKKMIKEKGLIQYAFHEIDEKGKIHTVILERNKGVVRVIYPVMVLISETKRSKLQIAVNSYLEGRDKVPTTIVKSQVVFRKNNKGDFAIHTPHHTVNIKRADVEKLKYLIED